MSRSGRLFQLLDALRGHRRPVTAAVLAERLGVSERTIYRDIQTLASLGAPVEGEAGVGYLLRSGVFLPPLMFDTDELEALVLGARWVRQQGDAVLAQAAANALAKIATASPRDLRDTMADTSLWVPMEAPNPATELHMPAVRDAIRRGHVLQLSYRDGKGKESERQVWPFALGFFEGARMLAAWCVLRQEFRHFRLDRIAAAASEGERYPAQRQALLARWRTENGIAQDA
ncbi:MAG: helix-turn-helix transcriptional regulator [Massilia sp.]